MLHDIDPNTGIISWHCHTPTCKYHNCQGWDRGITCQHHEDQQNQPAGETLTAHISDPGVQWVSPNDIALPPCPACGSRMTVHIHDDEDLMPPIVKRDEQTGEILQVTGPDHPNYHQSLWRVDADVIRKQVPHPSLAHLSMGQIQEMQAGIKNKAPETPVDWMLSEVTTLRINGVTQHPAVARHRELARQLQAVGKVYTPPVAGAPVPQESIEDVVTRLLQAHGLITTRLPAIPRSDSSQTHQ